MGKKLKTGRQRQDKFYKLAKETGFRSRASFKLLQLNRKFEFLQKSRVLIDLCAAPGGWLQVAQQAMPVSSLIIGIDLVSIKPLQNVITIQEDITTDRCLQALKKQLKTWKADVILHDGAPNVGKNWLHDAFSQNQLTLSALKLASKLLMRGGWFVTKIFRSRDYLSLIWVFQKLFKKVHVTKPQASRNESAEIFVVCEGFLAPDSIDPKFLDPNHVFKDLVLKETKYNLNNITKSKYKAFGYDDDAPLFSQLKVSDFIFNENHLQLLAKCNQIIFDDEDIRDHKLTTPEIKECCKDIKVLGKGSLRTLLNWRKKLRLAFKSAENVEVNDASKSEAQDEIEIDGALKEAEELEMAKLQQAKRRKKKILLERRKMQEKMNLKMIIKDDEPIIEEDRELFSLSRIKKKQDLDKVEEEKNLEFELEPTQDEEEEKAFIETFRSTRISYDRNDKNIGEEETLTKENNFNSSDEELEFESSEEEKEEESSQDLENVQNPLVIDLACKKEKMVDAVAKWFDKDDFINISEENDLEMDLIAESFEKNSKDKKSKDIQSQKVNQDKNKHKIYEDELDEEDSEILEPEKNQESNIQNKVAKKKKKIKLDPEGLALGTLMVQSKKMRKEIIENAYNRYASNDKNLPDWFVKDEVKHNRKQLPVPAELVAEYKEKLREINARPIKKVIQAKARKKRRALKRMEKARKKAEAITENLDMSEKEKREQLRVIYKKTVPKKENITYVVAKKGMGKRARRPAGVKGRYKIVDKRMKKDDRKQKMLQKSQKKFKNNKKRKMKK